MILMNPPYDGNLHLKILSQTIDKLLDENGTCVNLSPIRWLQDPLAEYKRKSIDWFVFEDVRNAIKDLISIDQEKGSLLFGILLNTELGVYVLDKNQHTYKFIVKGLSIIEKVHNRMDKSFRDVCESKRIDGIRVRVNELQPLEATDGRDLKTNKWRHFLINPHTETYVYFDGYTKSGKWWSSLTQNGKWVKSDGDPLPFSIKFDTEEEAINFENSCKTIFMNGLKNLEQIDLHVHLGHFPFMSDYTEPWTNERFCKYFGITGFISDTEAEKGSEWEEILETMKPYM